MERCARTCGWVLVAVQFVLLGGIARELARARRRGALRWLLGGALFGAGAAVVASGIRELGPAARAHPAPAAEAVLRIEGPYRLVRHPIYSGVLLCALGAAVAAGTRGAFRRVAVLVALLNAKARMEERLLTERFPEYEAYAARTPRFVPRAVTPR